MNVTDGDGDTPLYTTENIETARWLIRHGATVNIRNSEGISVSLPLHTLPRAILIRRSRDV